MESAYGQGSVAGKFTNSTALFFVYLQRDRWERTRRLRVDALVKDRALLAVVLLSLRSDVTTKQQPTSIDEQTGADSKSEQATNLHPEHERAFSGRAAALFER